MIGSVHALIISVLGGIYWWNHTFTVDYKNEDLSSEKMILGCSLSYWFLDTILILVGHIPNPVEIIVHHLITLSFLLPPFMYDIWPHEALALLWIGEITGPFNHFRYILNVAEASNTRLGTKIELWNGIFFCV